MYIDMLHLCFLITYVRSGREGGKGGEGGRGDYYTYTNIVLLLLILCRAASSAALSHNGGFRVGGGVHDSYTFQCGQVGSFTSPGIDTR